MLLIVGLGTIAWDFLPFHNRDCRVRNGPVWEGRQSVTSVHTTDRLILKKWPKHFGLPLERKSAIAERWNDMDIISLLTKGALKRDCLQGTLGEQCSLRKGSPNKCQTLNRTEHAWIKLHHPLHKAWYSIVQSKTHSLQTCFVVCIFAGIRQLKYTEGGFLLSPTSSESWRRSRRWQSSTLEKCCKAGDLLEGLGYAGGSPTCLTGFLSPAKHNWRCLFKPSKPSMA